MIKNSKLKQSLYGLMALAVSGASFAVQDESELDLSNVTESFGDILLNFTILIEKGLYFAGIVCMIFALLEGLKIFKDRQQGKASLAFVYLFVSGVLFAFPSFVKFIANSFGAKGQGSRVSLNATKDTSSLRDIFNKGGGSSKPKP